MNTLRLNNIQPGREAFAYQSRKGMECFKILFDWREL